MHGRWRCRNRRRFGYTLLRLFRCHPDGAVPNGVKFGIGCALAASADATVLDDVIALVEDTRHGENRGLFLKFLINSSSDKAQAAFEATLHDPQLANEARFLKRRRTAQSRRTPRAIRSHSFL